MKSIDPDQGLDRYLYRAVDSMGQTIDFLLTANRDPAAAKRFFRKILLEPANPGRVAAVPQVGRLHYRCERRAA